MSKAWHSWRAFPLYQTLGISYSVFNPLTDKFSPKNTFLLTGEAKLLLSRGWVGGSWVVRRGSSVVGCGSCLFEDRRINVSSLSGWSKVAIGCSRINFPEFLL